MNLPDNLLEIQVTRQGTSKVYITNDAIVAIHDTVNIIGTINKCEKIDFFTCDHIEKFRKAFQ